ncbi:MAG TPA: ABC transporter permease [Chitinophagaceae bacterium]|nr:ABC transporter permease [Chitinophagaceae bacterium]
MFTSYLKTAVRFLLKNKIFSLINILGLTLGTLCCLYILLYVADEYSYDRQHKNAEDIYRIDVHSISKNRGYEDDWSTTVAPVAALMKRDFPEVEQFTRVVPFLGIDKQLLAYKNKSFYETDAVYVDSTFFDVFNFHFVIGNPSSALLQPYSVVLLKPVADKLFGRENPVGKTISIDNQDDGKHDFVVQGVIDESSGKSHIHANMFITMNSGKVGRYMLTTDNWISNSYVSSYIKLKPGVNTTELEKKFPAFINRYGAKQLKEWGIEQRFFLQPVRSIHTTVFTKGVSITKPVNPSFLTILSLVAVLIQVIACINFMNLSTARASKRAKEVGVRKVIGAGRKDLIKQFIGESLLLSSIGVLLALPLLLLLLPYLNNLTKANITYAFLADYRVWLAMAGMIGITGLFAGSYPAFYLSAFRVIKVLKGNFTSHISVAGLRHSLVVFQFALSIILITIIVIMYSQLNFIKNKSLGFDKDQRLVLSLYSGEGFDKLPMFIDDVRKLAGVKMASNASKYLGTDILFNNNFLTPHEDESQGTNANFIIADEYFVKTNGIQIISGRDFRPADSAKVLVNETMVKKMGLTPATAVGTLLHDSQGRVEEIIGVMKDFNYGSLHNDVSNFLLWINNKHNGYWPYITVFASTSDYKSLVSNMEALWHRDMPGVPFDYAFMDEEVQKMYEADITVSGIITSFTLMAIFISCLGLFGLAAFSAEQRRKEISVRKVLGASVTGLAGLLSKDFLQLVGIAFIIAAPVAWWVMHVWLQGFAYKVTISWWMFAVSAVLSFLIALATVSYQAVKAAIANPVKILRSE